MEDLIKALQIFLKYGNPDYPTHCAHDVMYICGIEPSEVSPEDLAELDNLGFFVGDDGWGEGFMSYKFGST
jgi:hypothetical protein